MAIWRGGNCVGWNSHEEVVEQGERAVTLRIIRLKRLKIAQF